MRSGETQPQTGRERSSGLWELLAACWSRIRTLFAPAHTNTSLVPAAELLQDIVDGSVEPIFIVNGQQIAIANQAAEDLTGCQAAALADQPIDRLLPSPDIASWSEMPTGDCRAVLRAQQQDIPVDVQSRPLRLGDQQFLMLTMRRLAAGAHVGLGHALGPAKLLEPDPEQHFLALTGDWIAEKKPAGFYVISVLFDQATQNGVADKAIPPESVGTELTKRLRSELRASDVLVAIAGTEFAALVGCARDERHRIEDVAERLVTTAWRPLRLATGSCRVNIKVGIAQWPDTAPDPGRLYLAASNAAALAGCDGYPSYVFADPVEQIFVE